jgi:hypothetical protein
MDGAPGSILRKDVTPIYGGNAPTNAAQKLGNEVALNVGKGGPGAGRTMYGKSGSQQQYGSPAGQPKPQGADILSSFGAGSPNVAARKR